MLRWPSMQGGNDMDRPAVNKLTYDDFLCVPDDGRRHEHIDGEHVVTSSPAATHQRLVRHLVVALDHYLRASGLGEVFGAPFDVVLSNHDVVEPDVLVVLNDQRDILTEQNVRGAPLKRRLYARTGVREYWIVDPDAQAITVCAPADSSGFAAADILRASFEHVLTSDRPPGFSLALRRLFEQAPVSPAQSAS
jgi:Uma2 family endonuclease